MLVHWRSLSRPLFITLFFSYLRRGKALVVAYIVLYLHCPCTLHSRQETVTFALTHQIQWKHMFCQVYHQNTGSSFILHPHFSYMLWQVRKMWRKCTSHWHAAVLFQRICCQRVFFQFSANHLWHLPMLCGPVCSFSITCVGRKELAFKVNN